MRAIDAGALFVLLAWGRRSGKTLVMALIGIWHCLPRPEFDEHMLPDEERLILAVATTLKQARRLIKRAKALIKMSPELTSMVAETTDLEIRFRHGVVFAAIPCNSAGDRGDGASCLLLDEYAHHYDGQPDAPRSAEQLLAALLPSVAQFGSLQTVVAGSTSSGDSNKFAQLKDEITADADPTRTYHHGATWEVHPRLTEAGLANERSLLGAELFAQEFEASFLSGGGFFLQWDAIRECVEERGELEHHAANDWAVAIDPAFASDVFGVVVVGFGRRDPGRLIVGASYGWTGKPVGDSFEERRMREDELLKEVANVCFRFRTRQVVTDIHKAKEIRARMSRYGIDVSEVPFGPDSRREVFAALRLTIDDRRVSLPNDPDLLKELRAIKVRYTSRGQVVDLPHVGRSHCDRAVALALGVFAHGGGDAIDAAAGAAVGIPGQGWSDGGGMPEGPEPGTDEWVDQRVAELERLTGKDGSATPVPAFAFSPYSSGGSLGGSYSGSEFGG